MANDWKYSTYSKIDSQVKDVFPFDNPRENQLETISEIVHAINNGYKYIVLEAGTGTGKSAIAATLALMHDSTYILTRTKQLQEQYLKDFKSDGFVLVKGKNNFKCRKYAVDGIDETCEYGRCVLEGYHCEYDAHIGNYKKKNKVCNYVYQKCVALDSDTVITNYAFYFYELNNMSGFKKRQLVVFDEAHNVEDIVMDFLKLEFTRDDLKENVGINLSKSLIESLVNGDYHDWIEFVQKVVDVYSDELDKIKPLKENSTDVAKKFNTLLSLKTNCEDFIKYIEEDPENWIIDYDKFQKILSFKALKVDKYAKRYMFSHGDICLFMSATILDYKLFAKWLGISEEEIYAIRRKSPFDVARNPIKTYNEFNLAYSSLAINAPKTIDVIKEILNQHKNEKGLIHTVSNKCKDFIIENIDDNRLIHHKTYNRIKQLEKYKNSKKPLVFVSPSMNEGVDLPGNQCRFQIIYKLPFPNYADKQTKLRAQMDSQWYDYKTCLSLVQTYGRGMRFDKDFCKTYVIDSRFKNYVRRDEIRNNFLPNSFKTAIDITPAEISDEEKREQENIIEEKTKIKKELITNLDHFDDDFNYKQKVDLKYNLITKGNQLLENMQYDDAIEFYSNLLINDLFLNDYHPYIKLSKAFRGADQFDNEVNVLVKFFKSGIYCRKSKLRWFRKRLEELSELGYYDSYKIPDLLNEFENNGAKNRRLSDIPVPIAYKIIKNRKNIKKAQIGHHVDDGFLDFVNDGENLDYNEKIDYKYDLVKLGNEFIDNKEYDKAILFYNKLLTNKLFENDYHPYRKLSRVYRKKKLYLDEVNILTSFFYSGIYCNDKQLKWFKKQLKQLSKYGNFDYSKINDLENEFLANGANNKHLADTPVPIAIKIQKLKESSQKETLTSNESFLINTLNENNGIKSKPKMNSGNYSQQYFKDLAIEITKLPGYISDRDLNNHKTIDFVSITDFTNINEKADLKNKGKELEKEDYEKAVEFYNTLKKNKLFEYDYYPYRRQCILFKNRIKDDYRDLNTIRELFENEIYLNNHQYIWLTNKLRELFVKLDLTNHEISQFEDLIKKYMENKNQYESLQESFVPIAERIIKDEDGLKLLSKEKYDMLQDLYYVKELGVGHIRRKEYERAMNYYHSLLGSDFLYYQYHAYKQFARIFKEMDNPIKFAEIYNNL